MDQNAATIDHGTIHMLRVPLAQYAKVWINNTAILLDSKTHVNAEPVVFNHPVFRFDGFVNVSSPFIQHGTVSIIRVPNGKVSVLTSAFRLYDMSLVLPTEILSLYR